MMGIEVNCYAGYRGEETPRELRLGQRLVVVETVLDRWLAPDHRYFKVRGDDGGIYIIRHDPRGGLWELIFFDQLQSEDRE
ncbi:MAG: hypothetical protein P8010_03495 [Desulfosarcinaceae bacterium]|jgi:hypothetical protein